MILKKTLASQGNWLFKHRSYLPILLLPFIILALSGNRIFEDKKILENGFELFCFFISALGFFIRIVTVGYVPKSTSGRNTKKQIAKSLNTSGLYSITRNPLYLGNFLMWLGVIMFTKSIWLTLFFIIIYILYYERIIYAEEDFLLTKFGDVYSNWADKTPVFIPSFKKWKKPEMQFSLKSVLRREYSSFFGTVASFTLIEILENLIEEKQFKIDVEWIYAFCISLLIYLILRTLKKSTNLLKVKDR